jgi:hypothetical protein
MFIRNCVLTGAVLFPAVVFSQAGSTLQREYKAGQAVAYHMEGLNQGHLRTVGYTAHAEGVVSRNAAGAFVETFRWSDFKVNGVPFALSPESQAFREELSLGPDYTLAIPDLSKVQPILIGPITDLLAFYADVQLAMRQKSLLKAGDHVVVKHGLPNSWADGTYIVTGQDAIDFDITMQSMDAGAATYVIRHVPPAEMKIKVPVEWMKAPVADAANNWVEVEKTSDGKYLAEVGKETFEVVIQLGVPSGRILSASMDNPVEVSGRDCSGAALVACGTASRYEIRRKISLKADPE